MRKARSMALFERWPGGPWLVVSILLVVGAGMTPAHADDLSGANRLLCTAQQATRCTVDGCTMDRPAAWNIPQFIEVDLDGRMVRTTPASGENRSTPIQSLHREDGKIFIQGLEGGRAFSFVIDERTGDLNVAVATPETATAVFGVCTPLPVDRSVEGR